MDFRRTLLAEKRLNSKVMHIVSNDVFIKFSSINLLVSIIHLVNFYFEGIKFLIYYSFLNS